MYGKGYIYGLGIALILCFVIWQLDNRYYKTKHELLRKQLRKKKERLDESVEKSSPKTEDSEK